MAIKTKIQNYAKENIYCSKCKARCWVPNNNKKTQQNAIKMFGIIPNNCVNEKNGRPKCSFA